ALWRDGIGRSMAYGRYTALLVSLHAKTIYSQYFNFDKAPPEAVKLVRTFLDEQHGLQQDLAAALQAHPCLAAASTPDMLEANRLLIAALDLMSLQICWGVTAAVPIPDVPASPRERVALTLSSSGGSGDELRVEPWPFAVDRVEVRTEGRRLVGRFSNRDAMCRALAEAESVPVIAVLRPA